MFITPIQSMKLFQTEAQPEASPGGAASPFQDLLQNAITNMVQTEQKTAENTSALASGSIDDLHTLGIDSTKAYLAERLVIETRNRAMDAYSELMRINL